MRNHSLFARVAGLAVGAAACIVFALMATPAHASLISVYGDIGTINSGPVYGDAAGDIYDGSGPVPTPGGTGTTWNGIGDNALHTGLLDSTGGSTSITFQTNGSMQVAGGTPDPGLMSDDEYTGGTADFTFTNVPDSFAGYDLYLYSDNGGGYATTFTITVGTAATATATSGPAPGAGINPGVFVLNDNYVVLTGLHPTLGVLSGTFADVRVGDGGGFGILNGFQLVELPEPASLSLLGLGSLLMLRRRRA